MTQSGNESATFRFVEQCLDPLRCSNKHLLFSETALSDCNFKFRRNVFSVRQEMCFKYYLHEFNVQMYNFIGRCSGL